MLTSTTAPTCVKSSHKSSSSTSSASDPTKHVASWLRWETTCWVAMPAGPAAAAALPCLAAPASEGCDSRRHARKGLWRPGELSGGRVARGAGRAGRSTTGGGGLCNERPCSSHQEQRLRRRLGGGAGAVDPLARARRSEDTPDPGDEQPFWPKPAVRTGESEMAFLGSFFRSALAGTSAASSEDSDAGPAKPAASKRPIKGRAGAPRGRREPAAPKPRFQSKPTAALVRLHETRDWSDAEIVAGEEERVFPVHAVVVAMASPYLHRALFDDDGELKTKRILVSWLDRFSWHLARSERRKRLLPCRAGAWGLLGTRAADPAQSAPCVLWLTGVPPAAPRWLSPRARARARPGAATEIARRLCAPRHPALCSAPPHPHRSCACSFRTPTRTP